MDEKYDAALDLLRRLDPSNLNENLERIIGLEPELAEDLLSSIDVPLKVQQDKKQSGRAYLCCDYNRDVDSYRSPWSNEYFPELSAQDLEESPFPSKELRELEVLANDSFDVYRDLYYEGGISSVYLWDLDEEGEFAGVVLFKKEGANSEVWDSIHVIEATRSEGDMFTYRLTSTIILYLENNGRKTALSGNLTRQTEKDSKVDSQDAHQSHITNLGTLIEEVESQLRTQLEIVYFEKTRDIFHQTRTQNSATAELNKNNQEEIVKGLQNL
ncbi:F-actin-capping protein subunit beta [Nakaseomyces bracarensis]|uniref:F-actin-capping protein subunit beta n=1 Tax=Nakaseomyces bracarensis TaxID=273131 RepID=A0ABR4NX57_9SACH